MKLCMTKKHVSRAYGGVKCAKCACDTILQAFFTEKQQVVVKVLEAQAQSQKAK
ncbi:60S ribosomal protein L34 [Lemmus lemmus]